MHEYNEKYGDLTGIPKCPACGNVMIPLEPDVAAMVEAARGEMDYGQRRARLQVFCAALGCPAYGVIMNVIQIDRANSNMEVGG